MGLFSKLFNKEIKDTTPQPQTFDPSGNFHMMVDDVFTITGRGTVVTGRVDSGDVRVGDTVTINGTRGVEVTGIEMFRKTLDYAKQGDNCGLLLKGVERDDIKKGDHLTK